MTGTGKEDGMLKTYLQETSIHGLKYLSIRTHPVFKALWLVCILASFLAASTISYMNVLNWQSSPSVVSTVEQVLIKVKIGSAPKGG